MSGAVVRGRLLLWATAFVAAAIVGLPRRSPPVGGPAAVAIGAAAGIALFVLLAGRPRRPRRRPGLTVA